MTRWKGGIRLIPMINMEADPPHWIWNGATSPTTGYGCARGNNGKMTSAHRAVWELLVGNIPDGMEVLHHCDIRLCVNPNCLFIGTQYTNMQDAKSKGRLSGGSKKSQKGQNNNAAKYTQKQIDEVRRLISEGVYSQREIGRMTSVHYNTVWDIKKGRRWTT